MSTQQPKKPFCKQFAADNCTRGADCPFSHTKFCHYCKNEGHDIPTCPSLLCKNCGEQGHIAKKCPQPQKVWAKQGDSSVVVAKQPQQEGESQRETATCQICSKVLPQSKFSHTQWLRKKEQGRYAKIKCWECAQNFRDCVKCGHRRNKDAFTKEEWERENEMSWCRFCLSKKIDKAAVSYKANVNKQDVDEYDYDDDGLDENEEFVKK